jgi:hypothetical protein
MRYINTDKPLDEWVRECPVCDGIEGEMDMWVKHKDLNSDEIPFLRFMHGKKSLQKQ